MQCSQTLSIISSKDWEKNHWSDETSPAFWVWALFAGSIFILPNTARSWYSVDQNVRLAVRSFFVWHLQYCYLRKKNSKGDNHFLPSFVLDPLHDKISLTLGLSSLFCGWLSFDYTVLGEWRLNHFLTTAKNMGIPNLFLSILWWLL